MPYHNIPNAIQSTTNAQGKVAPPGYHYMPDGTLMSDAEHKKLYGEEKVISGFNLDYTDIPQAGERRRFSITADDGAVFSLEIKDEDGKYYNFNPTCKGFQVAKTGLKNVEITNGVYKGEISFPTIGDPDQYDVYLWAGEGTRHDTYEEVRFLDGSLDINSSTGSKSDLLQKVIYSSMDLTVTLSAYAPANTVVTNHFNSMAVTVQEITVSKNKGSSKVAFSIPITSASTKAFKINRQPTTNDIFGGRTLLFGSAPVDIPGEDIYPTVSDTDTVNGASSDITVTMDGAVASNVVVGDRVTGNTALNAKVVTVVALTGTYTFTLSEAITIADGITLSFSNRMNYRWPVNDISGIVGGMVPIAANITTDTKFGGYYDTTTINSCEPEEQIFTNYSVDVTDPVGLKPTVVKGKITAQSGNIVLDKQQKLVLAGDSVPVYVYGTTNIESITGYSIELSDLAVTLTKPTTTTTAVVTNSVTVPVASGDGIMDDVSTVSGIGIDSSAVDPTVTNIASYSGTTATLTLGVAQTLESGITLTFDGAGETVTISGNIEIKRVGEDDVTLYFDVEKFLTATNEAS